jgi:nitrate/nitrite-specific signal transduction histidine kinase
MKLSKTPRADSQVNPASTVGEFPPRPAGRTRNTMLRRLTLLSLAMALLVAAAGGVSLWFATRTGLGLETMRQTADQAVQISDMQSSWLAVVGTLDTFSLNRPSEGAKEQLNAALADLDQKLEALAVAPLGFAPAIIEDNRAITLELRGIGAEVADLSNEIYTLSEQGRWGTALQRRQVRLGELQARLDASLSRLDNNLQRELTTRSQLIQRQQDLARSLSLTTVTLAFLLALGITWINRRTIVKPLQVLIGQVKRITSGDFSSVTPMQRNDEIGDLSRSVALMAQWLNESYEVLEKRVDERTQELQRRTAQLQVAAAVARDVAGASNLDKLLVSAVNLIRDRFGFYHAGIFLNDARGEFAVLHAATGEAGRDMLDRQHKLRITSPGSAGAATGLVGRAAETGEAQLARDVELDPFHYKNPLLPDTRSEVALPLVVADRVIGVLDVQSRTPDAFDEPSIEILQVMADQLAIAIQNARLLQEVRENLNELQSAYGRIEKQEWSRLSRSNPVIGFEYDGAEATPITAQDNQVLFREKAAGDGQVTPLRVPLRVRGEVIGSLDVWPAAGELSEAEVYLLATISSRLSQVLEGARLLGQAQRLAAREQQINSIATQVRSAVNLESILQNTVRELGKALGTRRAYIQLGLAPGGNGDHPDAVAPDGQGAGELEPVQSSPANIRNSNQDQADFNGSEQIFGLGAPHDGR